MGSAGTLPLGQLATPAKTIEPQARPPAANADQITPEDAGAARAATNSAEDIALSWFGGA
jgi:hypothetical protein